MTANEEVLRVSVSGETVAALQRISGAEWAKGTWFEGREPSYLACRAIAEFVKRYDRQTVEAAKRNNPTVLAMHDVIEEGRGKAWNRLDRGKALALEAAGLSRKQVAERLGVSLRTVARALAEARAQTQSPSD